MLFKSFPFSQASGSSGGMTASRNRGGQYIRARAIPTNPNTGPQQNTRTAMSFLATYWANSLTDAQRAGWDVWALNTPLPGPLGEPRNIGGIGAFMRGNIPRQRLGLNGIVNPPTDYSLPQFANPTTLTASEATQQVSVGYHTGDPWRTAVDNYLLVYISRPQNAGINFFKGPYLFGGSKQGAVVPPAPPFLVTAPFAFVEGQKLFVRMNVVSDDGRLSSTIELGITAAA